MPIYYTELLACVPHMLPHKGFSHHYSITITVLEDALDSISLTPSYTTPNFTLQMNFIAMLDAKLSAPPHLTFQYQYELLTLTQ